MRKDASQSPASSTRSESVSERFELRIERLEAGSFLATRHPWRRRAFTSAGDLLAWLAGELDVSSPSGRPQAESRGPSLGAGIEELGPRDKPEDDEGELFPSFAAAFAPGGFVEPPPPVPLVERSAEVVAAPPAAGEAAAPLAEDRQGSEEEPGRSGRPAGGPARLDADQADAGGAAREANKRPRRDELPARLLAAIEGKGGDAAFVAIPHAELCAAARCATSALTPAVDALVAAGKLQKHFDGTSCWYALPGVAPMPARKPLNERLIDLVTDRGGAARFVRIAFRDMLGELRANAPQLTAAVAGEIAAGRLQRRVMGEGPNKERGSWFALAGVAEAPAPSSPRPQTESPSPPAEVSAPAAPQPPAAMEELGPRHKAEDDEGGGAAAIEVAEVATPAGEEPAAQHTAGQPARLDADQADAGGAARDASIGTQAEAVLEALFQIAEKAGPVFEIMAAPLARKAGVFIGQVPNAIEKLRKAGRLTARPAPGGGTIINLKGGR